MFLIYSFFYTITIIILFLPQYFRRPKELRQKWFHEKLGHLPEINSAIWIHAVSVGEVSASIQLLKKLRTKYPQFPIILSTMTDTGLKIALDKAPEEIKVVYLPFDLRFILRKCFKKTKPKIFIVIETELWPNIFRAMDDKGVPVIILNGRISEKSAKGYRRISFFMKKVFSYVRIFGMQSRIDADRLRKIGAEQNKVSVLGNFKFDMNLPNKIPSWANTIKGPVIVAGSTHRGEEDIIISAFMENLDRFPDLKLIIAPRHPERFKEVEDILKRKGRSFLKRSELRTTASVLPGKSARVRTSRLRRQDSELRTSRSCIILLDCVGELSAVYGLADIAIIGKSFIGFGGQNPLEPASWGKPILCGPHMENFTFIKDFYKEGAAFETEASALGKKIRELLDAPDKAKAAGEKAKALYMKNSGAVERAMKVIGEYTNASDFSREIM